MRHPKVILIGAWLFLGAIQSAAVEPFPSPTVKQIGPIAEVRMLQGAPAFFIDGQAHSGLSYMTYANDYTTLGGKPALPYYVRLFAATGCNLYTFVVDLGGLYGYTATVWPGRDKWDFAQVDRIARLIAGGCPPQAKFIVQLYIDLPEWWAKENPDHCCLLSNGSRDFGGKLFALPRSGNLPSIASSRWREEAQKAVARTIAHIESSDYGHRVVGYQVCGQKTEEWYHWSMNAPLLGDYGGPTTAAFRDWLKVRYGDDAHLAAAWDRPAARLAEAVIPSQARRFGDQKATFRNPRTEQDVLDCHRFWSYLMADTIAFFARVVKETTRRHKLVGAFYGYTFEFAELGEDAGHLALGRLLKCPDLDFIMAPSSYHRRELKGGQSCFRPPVRSLTLHGKLFWNDFDPASFKFFEKDQAEFAKWKPWLAVTDTAEEYIWMLRRELGHALVNGVNMAHFDHHGGYYDDPRLVAEVRNLAGIRREALHAERRSRAQVLLVVDEDSQHYLSFRNPMSTPLLSGQQAELPFVAPYDTALLSDLNRLDTTEYRLVLVVNAFKLEDSQRLAVREKLQTGGKTVLWLYAPGLFRTANGPPDLSGIRDATGIRVARRARGAVSAAVAFAPLRSGLAAPRMTMLQGDEFWVDDPDAEVLARREGGSGEVIVAARRFRDWVSIYAGAAPLPREFLRDAAIQAGVHLYHSDPKDAIYCNRHYLTLAAGPKPGPRTLRLREKATVKDLANNRMVARDALEFEVNMQAHEVRIFSIR